MTKFDNTRAAIHTNDMKSVRVKKVLKIVALSTFSLLLISITVASIYFFSIYNSARLKDEDITVSKINLVVNDNNGNSVEVKELLERSIDIDEASEHVKNAFVAVEDKRFYEHNGIDVIRIFGAIVADIGAGYLKEGGSTITQQLVKNTQTGDEKSIERKIKEMKLAIELEKKYDKNSILEMYLNNIYFGNGLYGIKSASEGIFGKNASELDVGESAVLAGIVKNPLKYSPLNDKKAALERRNLVLGLMLEQGLIDNEVYEEEKSQDIKTSENQINKPDISYIDEVIFEASSILGVSETEVLQNGYVIDSYLDKTLQNSAYNAVEDELTAIGDDLIDGYAITMDNDTCGITSLYSTFSYSVQTLRRRVGSTLKPFLSYIPAIEYGGYAPIDYVLDDKISFGDYSPKNYGNIYRGKISLREAVGKSSNMVALSLTNEIGLSRCMETAKSCGISFSKDDTTLPVVLGGMENGVTAIELLGAYGSIASGGKYKKPTFIKSIYKNGKKLHSNSVLKTSVFSTGSAGVMTDMLQYTASVGTAKGLRGLSCDVASKTGTDGTAEGNKNAVCCAYTPSVTAVVQLLSISEVPFDGNITGGNQPVNITKSILNVADRGEKFDFGDDVVYLDIDRLSLENDGSILLATENTPEEFRINEIFSSDTAPKDYTSLYELSDLEDFKAELCDYEVFIGFLAKSDYIYDIYCNGEYVRTVEEYDGEAEIILPVEEYGLNEYTVEYRNVYGVKRCVKKCVYVSEPIISDLQEWFRYFG